MEEKSRVPALTRCMAILSYLEKHKKCTISELISALKLPRSSGYVLVDEMLKQGLINQDKNGNLQLWMRLIELGSCASRNIDLRDKIVPSLSSLLDSVDCLAVHYGIMEGDRGFYVIKLESPRAGMLIKSREGLPVSLVHAGLGKCLLAYQSPEVRERILPTIDYTPESPTSITTPEALRAELAKIRLQGWAFDNSEGEADIRCVAAPVFNAQHELLGAISIVGSVLKFNDDAIPDVVRKVKQCASSIEQCILSY